MWQPTRRRFCVSALTLAADFWPAQAVLPSGKPRGPDDETYWNHVRSAFALERSRAYLNTASLGAPPLSAVDAVSEGYRRLAADPVEGRTALYASIDGTSRPGVASLLGTDPSEIALARSASEGLYWIAAGAKLQAGDEVVTTSQEHPAGLTPWLIRAERDGIVVRQVPMPSPLESEEDIVGRLSRAFTQRTRVLFFSHVTRGGMLYPARVLAELARSRGVLSAIDGAQAVGSMEVQLHTLGCDLYAASLHKWALAPAGNGFLYVRNGIEDRFDSLFTLGQKAGPATRHEAIGTYDLPCRAALARSIELLAQLGLAHIEARNRYLADRLKEGLRQIPGVRVVSGPSPRVSSPAITLFEISGVPAPKVQTWLYDHHRLVVDEHVRHGLDAVRVSTHLYNQPTEVDRLVAAVAEFVKRR